jgi:hypothetical protein
VTASRIEGVLLGFGLVALGAAWTLANMGQLDLLTTLRRWWPLLLVVWGALELANSLALRARGRR